MTRERFATRRVVWAIGVVGVLLVPARASAFCREVTEAIPPGYDPTDGGCYTTDLEAGVLPQLYWRNQCVNYNLNRLASRFIPLNQVRLVASQAFATWAAASCPAGGSPSILATEGPDVDCDDESEAHNNPIIFRDTGWTHTDSANTLGYTTLTVNLDTGEILGAEIEINTENQTIVATTPPPAGAYDLPSILTHEAGHFLGLAHSADTSAVMFARYHVGSTALEPDDVSGICTIYASDGSRNTKEGSIAGASCNPAPPLGFDEQCGALDASALSNSAPSTAQPSGDGGVGPLTESLFGCSTARIGGGASSGFVSGLALVGVIARRRRRTWRDCRAR